MSAKVRVLLLGHGGKDVEMPDGASVEDCINTAGYSENIGSKTITLNGVGVLMNTRVSDGDTISISGKVSGG